MSKVANNPPRELELYVESVPVHSAQQWIVEIQSTL